MTNSLNMRKFAAYAFTAAIINSIIFLFAKSADATMVVNQGGSQKIALPMVLASSLFGLVVAAFITDRIAKKLGVTEAALLAALGVQAKP